MSAIARSQLASRPMLNWLPLPRGNWRVTGGATSLAALRLVVRFRAGCGETVRGPVQRGGRD
jgi:hypothetical protein